MIDSWILPSVKRETLSQWYLVDRESFFSRDWDRYDTLRWTQDRIGVKILTRKNDFYGRLTVRTLMTPDLNEFEIVDDRNFDVRQLQSYHLDSSIYDIVSFLSSINVVTISMIILW